MFFRKMTLPFRELVPAGVREYRPSGASARPPPPPPKRKSPGSALKIAIAAAILGTGIAAMFSAHGKIISNNAVIATNLVSLRTPIDGMVSELPDRAGVVVAKGALIAHIENPRVNDEHLVDLRAHQTRVEADLKAARDNRADLLSLQSDLIRRDEIHIKVNGERLASLVNEAGKTHAALSAKEAQAQNDVDRHLPLEASGIVSKAEMHRLRSVLGARQDVAAQNARLAALRTEAEAAAKGVLTGTTGGTDKTYSAQRADQIAMEISNLDKTIATPRPTKRNRVLPPSKSESRSCASRALSHRRPA
jgi:multidrug resistance efflux pump